MFLRRKQNSQIKKEIKHTWICRSCGAVVPKKGALLSGDDLYKNGFHVHCPKCGRVVPVWVDPKETWQV